MSWAASGIFSQWTKSVLGHGQTAGVLPENYGGFVADGVKVALFNDDVTPDKDAALGSTGYNTGTWLASDEQSDTNWPAGGRPLANKGITAPGSGVVMLDADDLSGAGDVTLSDVHGCLVYDDDITAGTGGVADQGICFNYFGGAQSVTNGSFTIVWSANGIARYTHT